MADDVQLQDNHPDRYVVVKGDTLWGISGKFLKDPWKWPQVWKMNRAEIKNPHRIYPGDVVVLDTSSGQPQLSLLHENVVLQPGIREEELAKEAVPTIAPNVIAPFLSQPLVIENDDLDDSPVIIAGQEDRVALSPGTKIYISRIDEGEGLLWHVYRPGNVLHDPETSEALGVEAIYLGDASITRYGIPASGKIVRAKEEIFTNDKLVPAPDVLQDSFVPRAPDAEIKGRIMSIYGGVDDAGPNSIVTINRGSNDGLEEGHVLSINRSGNYISKNPRKKKTTEKFPMKEYKYKDVEPKDQASDDDKSKSTGNKPAEKEKPAAAYDPKDDPANNPTLVKLPDERIGLLMVFRTFERVSYALIMQASQPVNVLDIVQTP
jgi:hypothetical protein